MRYRLFPIFLYMVIISCKTDQNTRQNIQVCFVPDRSIELEFINQIQTDELSLFDFHYLYNGGGVGIADFNNDGFEDIFLGGNQRTSILYQGNEKLEFKDITIPSGVETNDWINGISILDLNHDGKKDIYLSVGGPKCDDQNCRNLLFINTSTTDKIQFEERSQLYGLDIALYSQQALFFDADGDGDLDMYQVQNYVDPLSKNYPKPKQYFSDKSKDIFLLNMEQESGKTSFVDASKKWGVDATGFGLGVALTDFNADGYPDIYVANDFISDDLLYQNVNGERFKEVSKQVLKHTSYNSMGVDIADFNNDQKDDILVVDMLPYNNDRQKTMLGSMNFDKFLLGRQESYNDQYIRNTLQINSGKIDTTQLAFIDIAPFQAVHETDWSWSPLIADFDNDGDQDIYISNGYGKNITDLDFVNYTSNVSGIGDEQEIVSKIKENINALAAVELSNHFFVQNENGKLDNVFNFKNTITNGVAYGDLDNDGDLDLVQNNINSKANILINETNENYLKVSLNFKEPNLDGIGSKITVHTKDNKTYQRTLSPVRSYLSSMSYNTIIGLGKDSVIQIEIQWPNREISRMDTLISNAHLHIRYDQSRPEQIIDPVQMATLLSKETLFENSKPTKHPHDFTIQPLLFKSCSYPGLITKAHHNGLELLLANTAEKLVSYGLRSKEQIDITDIRGYIVTDIISFTSKQNNEYICVSASSNIVDKKSKLILLEKSQTGYTERQTISLNKNIYKFAQSNSDFWLYTTPDASNYPLVNGSSLFKIRLEEDELALQEQNIHCPYGIQDIVFVDLDNDNQEELICLGNWSAPKIYRSTSTGLLQVNSSSLDTLSGLWETAHYSDLDQDGDYDLLLGNIGMNNRLHVNTMQPLKIVTNDIDNNGRIDPIMSFPNRYNKKDYSYASRDDLTKKIPKIKKTFQEYNTFAKAEYSDILKTLGNKATIEEVNTLASVVLQNNGNFNFEVVSLPDEVQYSNVNAFFTNDINMDGKEDLFVLQNCDNIEVHNGALDGSNGLIYLNQGNMQFEKLSAEKSGFHVYEPLQSITEIDNTYLVSSSKAIYAFKRTKGE